MKPDVHVIAPRYAFGVEHNASASLYWENTLIEAEPLDVSKGHLSVRVPHSDRYQEGESTSTIELNVTGRSHTLRQMRLTKVAPCCSGRYTKLVFKSEQDQLTSARLWEVSFSLRMGNSLKREFRVEEQSLPKVPARGIYTEEARQQRLAFLEQETQQPLEEVSNTRLDPTSLVSNIEAFIGTVEIPVGVAGPLHIKGEHADGLYYAPMATSEGALVASVTRGATALSRSGGVTVRVLGQRMFRVPMFVLEDLSMALFFSEWVEDHFSEIAEQTRKYSNFAKLVELQTHVLGKSVHVYFIYETGDAAGQNMTTTCTWQACQWIIQQVSNFNGIHFEHFMVDANLSNDKKVTYNSFLKGRGIRVLAECVLDKEICSKVLKVTPKQLFDAFNHFVGGSISSGMVGININIANVIAAMFAATGQDIACVHESSIGQLHMELTGDGDKDSNLYVTLMLPSLIVGSVGGGTNLPQQKECLQLLGCAGPGCAHKLAEIIASYCLALDISTLSAIASDQFARAHEKLGRNRPVDWLKMSDLNVAFYNRVIQHRFRNNNLNVTSITAINAESMGSSIVTELTSHKINKLVGHFPYELELNQGSPIRVMTKVKPLDLEVILMLNSMAGMCDARLAHAFNEFKNHLGFENCHVRELMVMSQEDERLQKYIPYTYYQHQEPEREAYVLVQEYLENLEMMDSADDTSGWTPQHIKSALAGIAEVHAIWYGKEDELREQNFRLYEQDTQSVKEKGRLWHMLGVHAIEEFPEWFSEADTKVFSKCLRSVEEWYPELDAMKKTLVHNDFNPRNIAFRKGVDGLTLCAYDWELAAIHVPQRDCAELLLFTLDEHATADQVNEYVEYHRKCLEFASDVPIDAREWRRGYQLCLWDILLTRVTLYLMAHTFRHYAFMDRVQASLRNLIHIERQFQLLSRG